VPGQGWSQPVVVGETVYLTAALGEGLDAPIGFAAGVDDPRSAKADAAPDVTIEWRVLAFDLATGKERWSASVCKAKPRYSIHPSNTWASETPVADANGVYAFFGATGTLAAFDTAGEPLWKSELGAHPMMFGYGTASSPAILDGKVFVQSFGEDGGWLACFEAKNGKELWRITRDAGSSWATPLLWRNQERTELVVSGFKLITSHEPASGKELWRVAGVFGPIMSSFAAAPNTSTSGRRRRSPVGAR
jgi:outer membrane protein assembly factor BamB